MALLHAHCPPTWRMQVYRWIFGVTWSLIFQTKLLQSSANYPHHYTPNLLSSFQVCVDAKWRSRKVLRWKKRQGFFDTTLWWFIFSLSEPFSNDSCNTVIISSSSFWRRCTHLIMVNNFTVTLLMWKLPSYSSSRLRMRRLPALKRSKSLTKNWIEIGISD